MSRFYDFAVDGLYNIFMWIINHVVLRIFGTVERALRAAGAGLVELIGRQSPDKGEDEVKKK